MSLALLTASTTWAHAYLDPGTGSLVLQLIIGGAIAAVRRGSRPVAVLPGDRVLLQHWDESRLFKVRSEGVRYFVEPIWQSSRLRGSYSPTVFYGG